MFVPIPIVSIREITNRTTPFSLHEMQGASVSGTMAMNPLHADKGSFKTCHPARLTLHAKPKQGLIGRRKESTNPRHFSNIDVVAKQYFQTVAGEGQFLCFLVNSSTHDSYSAELQRLNVHSEAGESMKEATVLLYAPALLNMVYTWIEAKSGWSVQQAADVPHVYFVGSGLGLVNEDVARNGAPAMTFIIEETIELDVPEDDDFGDDESQDGGRDGWIRYIANNSAVPIIPRNHPRYIVAEWCQFAQHLQYVKTAGLLYISDFQGTCIYVFLTFSTDSDDPGHGEQLSDPQIMTTE